MHAPHFQGLVLWLALRLQLAVRREVHVALLLIGQVGVSAALVLLHKGVLVAELAPLACPLVQTFGGLRAP